MLLCLSDPCSCDGVRTLSASPSYARRRNVWRYRLSPIHRSGFACNSGRIKSKGSGTNCKDSWTYSSLDNLLYGQGVFAILGIIVLISCRRMSPTFERLASSRVAGFAIGPENMGRAGSRDSSPQRMPAPTSAIDISGFKTSHARKTWTERGSRDSCGALFTNHPSRNVTYGK